jgi:hypothetical protein
MPMLWQSNTPLSPQPNEGTQLPATFGDTFDASWRDGLLFSSGMSQNNARAAALDNYVDEVRKTSGQDIGASVGSDLQFPQLRVDAARTAVAKLKQDRPGLQIPDLTDDELDRRAASIAGLSHEAFAEMSGREKTFGGKLGMLAGGLLAGAGDPLNLIFAPVPEAKLGIVATAALWAGLGTESAAINELVNAQFRERAVPGYIASGAPAANIAAAAAGGAVLGGLFKSVGAVWSRMKTGEWPRSVRDAGNIVESEANVQESNVLPGVEGEAAHHQALSKTIDDIVAGRPIEVQENVTSAANRQYQIMDVRDANMAPPIPAIEKPNQSVTSLEESARAEGFNTEKEFWHGTTLGKFTEFRESKLDNDVLGPASYLSTKAGAEFYGSGRGGDVLGPWWVRGEIARPETLVPYALEGIMAGKMVPAINALGRMKIELETGIRELWGKDLTPQQYANEFWKRRGFAGYDSGAGLEVAVYDPKNIRAGFTIEPAPSAERLAVPEPAGGTISAPARELISPRAVADQLIPEAIQQTLADPAHATGLMADLERIRDTGTKPQMVAIGTDAANEPQYQLLDVALQEIKDYENAASQIESCINPPAEEP